VLPNSIKGLDVVKPSADRYNYSVQLMSNAMPLPSTRYGAEPEQPESFKRLLESRAFEKTPALRALLTYLWLHRGESISEYAIATEALGRTPGFDARTDATVRVQSSRLRQRLEKFYEDEGKGLEERMVIPLGSHQIHTERIPCDGSLPERSPIVFVRDESTSSFGISKRGAVALGLLVVVLLVICGVQAKLLINARRASPIAASQSAAWFWKSFFGNSQPTRIVLPTPTFFSFQVPSRSAKSTVMFRDTEVNEFAAGGSSPTYQMLERMLGAPTLADNYTVTSDTFASVRLARYLDRYAFQTTVESSANAPLEALDSDNVIAIGTWGTLTPLKPYLDRMDFELGPHEDFVRIKNPRPGEPELIKSVTESPDRGIWPGVIALLPGRGGHTRLLILASRHTSALVSFLTSTNGLDQLARLWKAQGSPNYYEVAINAELSGRGLVKFWPVVLHPYKNPT
jgi:hypothetical protein